MKSAADIFSDEIMFDKTINTENKWIVLEDYANKLLINSSWSQLPDSGLPMSKRLEWQEYRDTLRSIRDDFLIPDDVIFPEEPAEE